MEAYFKEIETLIAQNETVKNENRKLRVLCAEAIGEIIGLF